MASVATPPIRPVAPFAPDRLERILALCAIILLACVLVALAKGYQTWAQVPALIWVHLTTIMIALGLTPVMLLRRRGDRLHRRLGWLWSGAMILTAIDSFFIHPTGFSVIHLLSVFTLVQVPLIVRAARTHNMIRHRRAVRGMVIGALLVAGFFTFPFNRLLGQWLFS